MKREEILYYMKEDKIYLFAVYSKKERVIELDTSSFFKFGEISDVRKLRKTISEILNKFSFGPIYMKPNLNILYNDVTNCDIKYLYENVFATQDFNKINFFCLTDIAKRINNSNNLVVFDKDYYTLINKKIKTTDKNIIDFDPILIGKKMSTCIHYSEENIIWNTFKSYFTKDK